jgi:hypothetical protein
MSEEYHKISIEEIEEGISKFTAVSLELENAMLVFFNSKGQNRLGTLAVALPRIKDAREIMSSVLLGSKHAIIAKVFATHLAKAFNKITLISINLENLDEKELGSVLSKLTKRIIEGRKQVEDKNQ